MTNCGPEPGTEKNSWGWGQEDKPFHFSGSFPGSALACYPTTRDVMGFQNSSIETQMSLAVVFGGGNRTGAWAEKTVPKREVGMGRRPSMSGWKTGSAKKEARET